MRPGTRRGRNCYAASSRARRYLHYIVEEVDRRGLPMELALLPAVESSFNPMALSSAQASGLWQFIPGTGTRYKLAQIVEALSAKPLPHLVLLDVLMPDATGFDVLNRIRHHPDLKHMQILMLTALGDREDITRGLTLGADGYLTKPVLPSVLLEAIETLLGG